MSQQFLHCCTISCVDINLFCCGKHSYVAWYFHTFSKSVKRLGWPSLKMCSLGRELHARTFTLCSDRCLCNMQQQVLSPCVRFTTLCSISSDIHTSTCQLMEISSEPCQIAAVNCCLSLLTLLLSQHCGGYQGAFRPVGTHCLRGSLDTPVRCFRLLNCPVISLHPMLYTSRTWSSHRGGGLGGSTTKVPSSEFLSTARQLAESRAGGEELCTCSFSSSYGADCWLYLFQFHLFGIE